MKFQLKKGETSVILIVVIQDASSTVGSWLAGLTEASSMTGGYVKRNGIGVALTVDENVTTEGTYQSPTTSGQVRIGTPANMVAGTYELHFHNDLFTTADYLTVTLTGATDMAPVALEIQLTDFDLNTPNVTAAEIVDEWETQSQADPTGFQVNVLEIEGSDATDALVAAVNVALDTTISELSQAQPPINPTIRQALMLPWMKLRNKLSTQTSGVDALEIYNNAGTLITKKLLTDDGADYIEAKMVTGP